MPKRLLTNQQRVRLIWISHKLGDPIEWTKPDSPYRRVLLNKTKAGSRTEFTIIELNLDGSFKRVFALPDEKTILIRYNEVKLDKLIIKTIKKYVKELGDQELQKRCVCIYPKLMD